ncbi:MAG: oligosaccharide flippase family protein [Vicinamibacterales bacterium]
MSRLTSAPSSLQVTQPGDRRGLVGNAATYTLANVANSAIPFLLLPVLTRVLSPEEFGLVTIFTTLMTAFGAFAGLSVHGAVNVRYFDVHTRHARYVGTALVILGSSTFAVLVVVFLAAPWISGWSQIARPWLFLAVLASGAQFVIQIRLVTWQVRRQPIRYGVFQVLQTALNLGLSLLLIIAGDMGAEGRFIGVVVAVLLFAAVGLLTLHRARQVEWGFDLAYAKDALRFGIPLIPHVVGGVLIAASDRLMVAKLMSVRDAGIYAAGMQIGLVIAVLADAMVKAIGPWLFASLARDDDMVKRNIVRMTYLCFIGIAALSVAFSAAAPHLLLLVGEQFRSSQDVVVYVALGAAFGGMYLMVVNYIFYAKRTEFLSAASLSVGTLNLIASYFLIGRYGAVGAAQAYAGSQLLLFVLTWFIAARCHPMPWHTGLRGATVRSTGT